MRRVFVLSIVSTALMVGAAQAADIPVKAPVYKAQPVPIAGGFYGWVDGMYERVNLPNYAIGFHGVNVPVGGLPDAGNLQSFTQRLDGGGVRGGLGFTVPSSSIRLEASGSYLTAQGSGTQSTLLNTAAPGAALSMLLSGASNLGGPICTFAGFSCTVNGKQSTHYDAWQLNGKAAQALKFNNFTLIPSIAVFGGETHANQSLVQVLNQFIVPGGALNGTENYAASTRLKWTDIGARAGLDATVPFSGPWAWGIGISMGFARRDAHFAGSDSTVSTFAPTVGSVVATSRNATAFVATAETGVSYKISANLTARGFVGVNFDSRVPGITSPGFAGSFITPTPIPAGIAFRSEAMPYGGAGVIGRF